MTMKKVALVFIALVLLLASPLAYASQVTTSDAIMGEENCILSPISVPGYDPIIYPPIDCGINPVEGLYTWVDHSRSDASTERGNFLRLGHVTHDDTGFANGLATYGTYETNRSDYDNSSSYTTLYSGSWYPVSAETIHLQLFAKIWLDYFVGTGIELPIVVFSGDLPVSARFDPIMFGFTRSISLFGYDLAKIDLYHWYPPIVCPVRPLPEITGNQDA